MYLFAPCLLKYIFNTLRKGFVYIINIKGDGIRVHLRMILNWLIITYMKNQFFTKLLYINEREDISL